MITLELRAKTAVHTTELALDLTNEQRPMTKEELAGRLAGLFIAVIEQTGGSLNDAISIVTMSFGQRKG